MRKFFIRLNQNGSLWRYGDLCTLGPYGNQNDCQSKQGQTIWLCFLDWGYCICWSKFQIGRRTWAHLGFVWWTDLKLCRIYCLHAWSWKSWKLLQLYIVFQSIQTAKEQAQSNQLMVFFWLWSSSYDSPIIWASLSER